jgi:hypothetical protein
MQSDPPNAAKAASFNSPCHQICSSTAAVLRPISDAASALSRLDERIARSDAGSG